MKTTVVIVEASAEIRKAAGLIVSKNSGRIPVKHDKGRLV